jgi:phosphoglycolate phosphatase-like HAD superfamily hydrolase
MNMIKCVVFDFDGTLVDSNAIKRDTFFEVAHPWDASGEIVAEVFERWPGADRYEKTRRIAEELIRRGVLPVNASPEEWGARLADDYTERCERAIASCPERPGASQALAELSAMGLLLFVNSGTPAEPLRRVLELRDWVRYFKTVYGAEGSKADNLKGIARESGVTRHEMVHIGDQPDDRRGAELFGCHFVAMAVPCSVSPIRESPLLIEDLRELPVLVARLSRDA